MYNQLKSYIQDKELLIEAQYGFRKKFSSEHPILDMVYMTQANIDKQIFPGGSFLDFKKVFDIVNRTIILADSFHSCGVRVIVHIQWLSLYLANRMQTDHIDSDHISSKKNSELEFLKGRFFLIYVNDINLCSNKFCFYLLRQHKPHNYYAIKELLKCLKKHVRQI